jgi:signal transduction histidine kinase
LNGMLDRIESSMHQLHTITDALAHDLRSPLTAIRGKLEMSLSRTENEEQTEPIVSAIEELDQLTDFLNKSLVLLCYKKSRRQQGHLGRERARCAASWQRRVAMEYGLCRSVRAGSAAGGVDAFGTW